MASEEALLTEYQTAHDEVNRLNGQLWTTAQILIPLSLAGIGFLSSFTTHTIQTLTTILLAASGSSLILWGWYRIASRWLVYQNVTQHRMKEIEEELDIWCVRYEAYVALKSRGIDLLEKSDSLSQDEILRYKNLTSPMIPKGKPTAVVIRNLALLMVLTWGLLVVREAAFILGFL
jgi:hypothetical protein